MSARYDRHDKQWSVLKALTDAGLSQEQIKGLGEFKKSRDRKQIEQGEASKGRNRRNVSTPAAIKRYKLRKWGEGNMNLKNIANSADKAAQPFKRGVDSTAKGFANHFKGTASKDALKGHGMAAEKLAEAARRKRGRKHAWQK